MQVEEILAQLEINTKTFPRLALEAAIEQREAITPILISTLDKLSENLEQLLEKEDYILHIHALYLLAQFREESAYPTIIKFFSVPGDVALDVTGDIVTEDLGRILACVSGGRIEPIKQLIENSKANEYVRGAALEALLVLIAQEVITREQVIQYYAKLFSTLDKEDHYIQTTLVTNSAQLCAVELQEQINRAFEQNSVDLFFIDQEDVSTYLVVEKEEALNRLRKNPKYSFIKDVILEMENWSCFQPQEKYPSYNIFIPEGFSLGVSKKSKNKDRNKKKMQKQSRRKNRSKKK
ncbi:DUF1186 family protein (plasmid) [Anabaena sp. FACHB-709]|uniref:DUF1186 domain-containing protein n=2 Tax=Nostocaceae TaxID=1162 RepID=A0A1Z4KUU7_ANAVA|nr:MULTISPECIES: DUF1186 family protein [Nostocaceae]BAY72795.1 hypothetical protein NIES23_56230 [Trichormus variabilis NIES-23]MBD2174976.1 DUF1186 family protein [Anabaena cylindrica FACHB-318]MBD2266670.1 DUF1186 family protein [Anabaena sp. FACHB-709]MBD2276236.1 DUF1186 family protein [Nostoc sp. PCC 7120 = FACHB-418]MBD2287000.1 DUF1186 family protein [Anabaena cylindrica FACHB-170]